MAAPICTTPARTGLNWGQVRSGTFFGAAVPIQPRPRSARTRRARRASAVPAGVEWIATAPAAVPATIVASTTAAAHVLLIPPIDGKL